MIDNYIKLPLFYDNIDIDSDGYIYKHKMVESFDSILLNRITNNMDIFYEYKTYIFYNPTNQLFKIGKSKNIKKRLNELSKANGIKLMIIKIYPIDIEKKIHDLLIIKRQMEGEWFRLDPSDFILLSEYIKNNFHNHSLFNNEL